jgi:hypothetical protein
MKYVGDMILKGLLPKAKLIKGILHKTSQVLGATNKIDQKLSFSLLKN